MPLRAGNLGRVSKDKSGTVRSVSEQHEANRAEIDANGHLEVSRYEDEGSASRFATKERPDWIRLLADIEADRLDIVYMWDSARGSRELEDWAGFLRRCREHHVLIYVTTSGRTYNMDNGHDWKTLADDGVDAAFESEKKSRDAKRGLAANRRNGLPHGICKFGFERIHDEKTGALLGQRPVPEHAAVCAEIIRRVAATEPISVIRDDLEKRQVPAPGGGIWYRRTLHKIATSPAYIGKIKVDGELIEAQWEPVIDELTFWAAQHVLSAPGRKVTRPGRARHLLSYLMTCAECGSALYADLPRKKMITANYMCSDAHKHCARVPMADADAFVTAAVKRRCAKPDIYSSLTAGSDEKVMAARAEAARLRAELDEWADSDISARAYAIREAKLLPLIQAADKRATELSVPPALRDLFTPGADIDACWDAMHVAARREAVRLLFPDLRLMPGTGPASERIINDPAVP
jgi:DNA invertase Pin-like site-specific DNA recombinase